MFSTGNYTDVGETMNFPYKIISRFSLWIVFPNLPSENLTNVMSNINDHNMR